MKTIVVGFSKPKEFKLYAWLIMKCDKANFDHAYLKFYSDSLDREIIYQAIGKGVGFIGNILFHTKNESVEEFKLSVDDNKYIIMMQFCIDNSGMPYGFLEVLGMAWVKVCAKLGKTVTNPFNKGDKQEFCSEIVSRCLNVVKPEEFNIDVENISPKELNSLLKQLNVEQVL